MMWNPSLLQTMVGCENGWAVGDCKNIDSSLGQYGMIIAAMSLSQAGLCIASAMLTDALCWRLRYVREWTRRAQSIILGIICYLEAMLSMGLATMSFLHLFLLHETALWGVLLFPIALPFAVVASIFGIVGAFQERRIHLIIVCSV